MVKRTHFVRQLATLVLTLLFSTVAPGAENSNQPDTAAEPTGVPENLSDEEIDELISTLESDSARERFINNLRTLVSAAAEEEVTFSLRETFAIDRTSNALIITYQRFLRDLGLDGSTANKILLSGLTLLFCVLFAFINRWLSHYLDRSLNGFRRNWDLSARRFGLIFSGQRLMGYAVALLLFVYTVSSVINSPSYTVRLESWGVSLAGYAGVIMLLLFVVLLAWESINAFLEYGMSAKSNVNSARVITLFPVTRNIAFILILLVLVLVMMSELGIDILPFLAGAGVLGIAIGFGAQTMVKDFLNGFTLILEDLVQVGDIAGMAGKQGKVERITLRKIQLRNLDGTVHTIPHSEITVVDNLTKLYSYYLMDIGIAYKEDTDEVVTCLEEIDRELRMSEEFGDLILEPLQILGVEQFTDSAVIIRARTKTKPLEKWTVGREFNRRIKKAFDEKGIEIPFPHRTLYFANTLEAERRMPDSNVSTG